MSQHQEKHLSSEHSPAQILKTNLAITRLHLWIALGVSVVSFLFYALTTLVPYAVPGEPTSLLAAATGTEIDFSARYCVWKGIVRFAAALVPTASFVFWINLLHTAFSALVLGLTFLVTAQFFLCLIDPRTLKDYVEEKDDFHLRFVTIAAGAFSAVALMFSAPYWFAATQPYPYAFYLSWLLLTFFFLLRYASGRRLRNLYLFLALTGLGMGQTASFIGFAPLTLLIALYLLWSDDRLSVGMFLRFVLAVLVPMVLMIALEIYTFSLSEGWAIFAAAEEKTWTFLVKQELRQIVLGVITSIPRVWWLILLSLTVLPFLAAILTASRALSGRNTVSIFALNVVIGITAVLVLLDLRFSPWQFYNVESLQILPYCMVAMSFGYVIGWGILLALESDQPDTVSLAERIAIIVLASLLMVYTVFNNRDDARLSGQRFVQRFTDGVLDHLRGRNWLVTVGPLDSSLSLRARERGLDLHIINLGQGSSTFATANYKGDLPSVRLQNVADIGTMPLLREWIAERADGGENLALMGMPDIWSLGNYDVVPYGLAFFGESEASAKAFATDPEYPKMIVGIMDALEKDFEAVPEDAYSRIEFNENYIRRQTSFIANNTAYLMDQNGLREEAFAVYDRALKFDPDNISVMLNWATMIQQGIQTNRLDEVRATLEAFQEKGTTPPTIWRLSSMYGYVANPQAFASLGWTWALSGQSELALHSLRRASQNVDSIGRARIQALMADLYMRTGDFVASEDSYKEVLKNDAMNPSALIGMTRLCVSQEKFDEARQYLTQARDAGVTDDRILFESAAIELAAGETDRARVHAETLRELDRENPSVFVLLSHIYTQNFEKATRTGDQAKREEALKDLQRASDELIRLKGANDFLALFMRGRTAMMTGRYAEAREDFQRAVRVSSGGDIIPVMDLLLRMDYALTDESSAVRHARELLAINPDHAFANYILGSVQLSNEHYSSAEDYLERSLQSNPNSIFTMNDLACAKLELNKLEEAESLARRALAADNTQAPVLDTLGCVLLAKGDTASAREAFEEALRHDKENPYIHLHYAQALVRLRDFARATEIIRRVQVAADQFSNADKRRLRDVMQQLADR